ncbi:hypothetical protein EYF80_048284 [Liparis tanakae]|uniref:Uncharacterized protein n=1 Tax=Liparis tanakae TaxID=230148 RepID=A0A4Z2FLB8_9TELE|nr:hypothetical protein EYF80_048284 [Liparis tanakae]
MADPLTAYDEQRSTPVPKGRDERREALAFQGITECGSWVELGRLWRLANDEGDCLHQQSEGANGASSWGIPSHFSPP